MQATRYHLCDICAGIIHIGQDFSYVRPKGGPVGKRHASCPSPKPAKRLSTHVFVSRYPSLCRRCGQHVEPGDVVRMDGLVSHLSCP
jgi:hypothetical protein